MPSPEDRRTEERFPVNTDASCSFVAPVVEDFGPAKIRNVSMNGIGLLLARRVEPGAMLTVTLSNKARGFTKTVLVRVVHASPQAGSCLIGGTFDVPLTYQEMSTLVL
jgi:hypothetical protein